MDASYYKISVACDTTNKTIEMWGQFEFVLPSPSTLVWSTPLGLSQAMWRKHAPTFNKWRKKKKKKKKKKTPHILIHGTIGLGWLLGWFALMTNYDIRERNVTIRSEIWTRNVRSLGFQDIREYVTLWRLILQSLGCTYSRYLHSN
jgi:hypothetical protein